MDDYFAESDEHLTAVRRILLTATPDSPAGGLARASLEELFRSFHSLKGLSGMVELRDAELLAHHMESYLRLLRDRESSLTLDGLDALIDGATVLEQVIAARRGGLPAPSIATAVSNLERVVGAGVYGSLPNPGANTVAAPERWCATFTPSKALADRGVTVDRVRARLRDVGHIVDAAPRIDASGGISFEFIVDAPFGELDHRPWLDDGVTLSRVHPSPDDDDTVAVSPEAVDEGARMEPSAMLTPSHVVRVDLARLDDLMRMIGDLVICRARLTESLSRIEPRVPAVEWRAVQENSLALERQLRALREGVVRVRLVPVGEIFRRMPFVVRDLARETGKAVELRLTGQDTEIDKFLVERMMDPILHLVRNAVSHGLESPVERRAVGKPETGSLTLSAANVGDVVTLEIADDGRGIDPRRVAARARDMGLPVPEGALDSTALLGILCTPGFSTRDEADRASGRGVGMDVVRSAVRELGGALTLDTAPGEGTRFLIELPLTLAIADAILASVGPQTFAVPQSMVREVIEVDPASLKALENHEIAQHRGAALPILRLGRVFGLASVPRQRLHVFVIGQGLSAVGVAVDRILGQREIVVRPMTDALVKVEGVTGATDLGDGKVVLILDLSRLIQRTPAGGPAAALTPRGPRGGVHER
jgi:two-component system chemotaxis sensor kinase CheA